MNFCLDNEEMTAFDLAKALKQESMESILRTLGDYDPVQLQRLHESIHAVLEHKHRKES
jgi:hypothetical protein